MRCMNKTEKSIFIIIIAGVLPAVNLFCKIADIAILESPKFQSTMLTASAIFMGCTLSALGILLGLRSHKTIEKVAQTNIMPEKIDRFTEILKYMSISIVLFLASILGVLDFLNEKIPAAKDYFLMVAFLLFLVGLARYVLAVYDLVKVIRILSGVDEEKRRSVIDEFEKLSSKRNISSKIVIDEKKNR